MSVYKSGVEAYRDTTKWLAAFTPVTVIISAVVVAGAPVGESLASATDKAAWFSSHLALILCALVILLVVGVILFVAARVLSQEPVQVIDLQSDTKSASALETAFGKGIASPDFISEAAFDKLAREVFAGGATTDDVARLRAGHDAVREWKLFIDTKRWFVAMLWVMGAGALLVCIAIAVALTQVDSSAAITKPTRVAVAIDSAAIAAASTSTGCLNVTHAEFWAVGGTWDAPVLAARGSGCRFAAHWTPSAGQADVLPASPQ